MRKAKVDFRYPEADRLSIANDLLGSPGDNFPVKRLTRFQRNAEGDFLSSHLSVPGLAAQSAVLRDAVSEKVAIIRKGMEPRWG